MSIVRLRPRLVEKIWGRRDLPAPFGPVPADAPPIGEIWFDDPDGDDAALLVKYLFTSEKLSIQVHPDDAAARLRGHERGKEEAWHILDAEPGATIGLGLREPMTREALRHAAVTGRIEALLDWRPVRSGDFYYSPAGTIHALGAGLALIEVQQNADLTYRLFDYGRDREIHIDEAVAVAEPGPYVPPAPPTGIAPGRSALAHGRAFVLERWTGARIGRMDPGPDRQAWVIPTGGGGSIAGETIAAGGVWKVRRAADLALDKAADMLVAYPGGAILENLV